ncbi:hypothetical protein D3C76_1575220 [compost metagenome]
MAIQQQSDVSLRAGSNHRYRFRAFTQHFCHQFHGSAILRGKVRLGQGGAIKAAFAVDVIRNNQVAHQGFNRPSSHRNITALQQGQHPQHIAQGFIRGLVSGRRGHRLKFQLG